MEGHDKSASGYVKGLCSAVAKSQGGSYDGSAGGQAKSAAAKGSAQPDGMSYLEFGKKIGESACDATPGAGGGHNTAMDESGHGY